MPHFQRGKEDREHTTSYYVKTFLGPQLQSDFNGVLWRAMRPITLTTLVPTRYNCTETVSPKLIRKLSVHERIFSQKWGRKKAHAVRRMLRTATTAKEQACSEITRQNN